MGKKWIDAALMSSIFILCFYGSKMKDPPKFMRDEHLHTTGFNLTMEMDQFLMSDGYYQ